MKKKSLLALGILIILVLVTIIFTGSGKKQNQEILVEAQRGKFDVIVTTTGELQAENSVKINGPMGLRKIRIWNVKITDLIPEGSLVDSGDYVGQLDRTEAVSKLKDMESELEKAESNFIKVQLDTTLELRQLRDNLINLKFAMEEAQIKLEQSKFEPPATIRQAEIDAEKAGRNYKQTLENYKLKVEQANAKMNEVNIELNKKKREIREIQEIMNEFDITAPKPGMLIYYREWDGERRKVGSMISTWNPVVATLPDLTSMISVTYINEIDFSKIEKGQPVEIGVDAFPEKKYTGEVNNVANIGEQMPNNDAKVFKVEIKVHESDSILRPAMTTSNAIVTASFEDVVHIPLEALHNNDSLTYVIKEEGFKKVKQIIKPGKANENRIIVSKGLKEGDKILLTDPENEETLKFAGLELLESLEKQTKEKSEQEKTAIVNKKNETDQSDQLKNKPL